MSTVNIFEQAARKKIRFTSVAGLLSVEQLWELPLQNGKTKLDLDTVAKTANGELSAITETSFVKTSSTGKDLAELKMDIVKHIIADKIAEMENNEKAALKRAERQTLLGALERSKGKALEALTPAEIEARLAALDS